MTESFTCPDCKMTSYHPKDIEYSYCGNCHEFKPSSPGYKEKGRKPEELTFREQEEQKLEREREIDALSSEERQRKAE